MFILTLVYISIALLSPAVLPEELQGIHILQILAGVIAVCSLPLINRSKILMHPETYFVTGVLVAGTVSILATGWIGGAINTFIDFLPVIFTFYFVVIGCTTLNRIIVLSYLLCAIALFVVAQGMIAEFTGSVPSPYVFTEQIAGANLYRIRGLGVISDPNDLAQVLVAVLPLLWLRSRKANVAHRVLLAYVPAVMLAVGVYYTHSRGGTVALIAVVLFGLKDAIGVIGSSVLTGLLTLGALALNVAGGRGMNQDDGERISLWSQALTAFKTHPIFGVGMGRFADYNNLGLTAHNSYVLCLAELGIVGYFFWMGSIVSIWSGLSQIIGSHKSLASAANTSSDNGSAQLVVADVESSSCNLSGPLLIQQNRYEPETQVWKKTEAKAVEMPEISSYESEKQPDSLSLVQSAKALRVALLGVLAAAFFISRTYSIIVYIVLGLATSLDLVVYRKYGGNRSIVGLTLLRKVGYVMAGSVLFLYLFVRLHPSS